MSRKLDWNFSWAASYELVELERIDRSGGKHAYSYPYGTPVDPQQELADGPILEVRPAAGDPWVAVVPGTGEYRSPNAARSQLIGWPDERSFCVLYRGAGSVVRSDDPRDTYEIDTYFITSTVVLPERGLVVFGNFTNLLVYGADGLVWESPRLALDELKIRGVDGDQLRLHGFFGGSYEDFTLDLREWRVRGAPMEFSAD